METVRGSTSGHTQVDTLKPQAHCLFTPVHVLVVEQLHAPTFVGSDYYCESGLHTDPLWDGQDCGGDEGTCCDPPNLPWFCKELPEPWPTTDDLEVRLCADQGDDDVPIELVELYIQ